MQHPTLKDQKKYVNEKSLINFTNVVSVNYRAQIRVAAISARCGSGYMND